MLRYQETREEVTQIQSNWDEELGRLGEDLKIEYFYISLIVFSIYIEALLCNQTITSGVLK